MKKFDLWKVKIFKKNKYEFRLKFIEIFLEKFIFLKGNIGGNME